MKISSNQKLFAEYIISLLEQMYSRQNNTLNSICSPVRNNNKEMLIQELSRLMFDYNIENGILNLSKVQQSKIFKELSCKLDDAFNSEFLTEKECIKDILNESAKDSYYINSFVASIGIDYNLKAVKGSTLKKIINHKIDEKTWSDRLWDNKKKLRADMKLQVKKFLNGQTNVNNIGKVLEKKYSNNKYVTERLVTNEISIIQGEANKVWRENHNINYVIWDATLDSKTCHDCGALDGKVFPSDDIPYNGHKHILCRCNQAPLINKDWRPAYRHDNKNKVKIPWVDFETWKKNNI